jgi:hypothetical protein
MVQRWNGDFFPLPGQAVFDHEKQQLAVVSRFSGQLDVFVIGFDNHTWSTYWGDHSRDRPWAVILCRFKGEAPNATLEAPADL